DAVDQREPESHEDIEDPREEANGQPLREQGNVDLHALFRSIHDGALTLTPALSLTEGEGAAPIPPPPEGERDRVRGRAGRGDNHHEIGCASRTSLCARRRAPTCRPSGWPRESEARSGAWPRRSSRLPTSPPQTGAGDTSTGQGCRRPSWCRRCPSSG